MVKRNGPSYLIPSLKQVINSAIEKRDERVLVFAPTGRDAELTCGFLQNAGMAALVCRDMADLVRKIGESCGAIILAEETLGATSAQMFTELLSKQPSWSEIPLCIITSGGEAGSETLRRLTLFSLVGNATILERPFRPGTLVNTMQVALRSRRRQYQVRDLLEERSALAHRFRTMAEAMPHKIFTATPAGDVDYLNRQWREFTGLSVEEMKNWGWTRFIHPADLQENLRRWKSSVETGDPLELEQRFRGKDDVYRWHLSRARAIKDEHGRILMWVGSNTDIDDQKKAAETLEKMVSERTASLSETNKQLEAFTYTVSHDLRAPLRAQQGFANALLEEFGDVLGEAGRDYAERIHQAATRLQELVDDLLAYSRVSRAELPLVDVDLRKEVRLVHEDMTFEIQKAKAKVHVDEFFFSVRAHEVTLRTAITNLLANALKFTRPGVPPEIRVSAEERDKWIRLWVEDNGIGIAPEHQQQIFGVFHRLHKMGEYPGTGVGLAIVRKGVERLGGRVGVESEPGKGSRFWIELEKAA
jgi:PAS domain S-box-containing protein